MARGGKWTSINRAASCVNSRKHLRASELSWLLPGATDNPPARSLAVMSAPRATSAVVCPMRAGPGRGGSPIDPAAKRR